MTPAPALDCAHCGRTIGKRAAHYRTFDQRVMCGRCISDRRLHSQLWPACPHAWHDNYDHLAAIGTRAGVAAALGLWPIAQGVTW